ncbi:MAG: Swt1 family HEPN domain-containing protein [Thermodesulfobacteriota bacterium]
MKVLPVRELVAQRLEERKGSDWWNTSVPENVRKRVEQKRNDIEKNKWHQADYQKNIDLTLFGDLAAIIIKEWVEFDDLFPSQPWVKQRLDELERSRNVIAHANPLPAPEIERIEQYLEDWLRQVP